MIHRPKNNPKNGDSVVPWVQSSLRCRNHQACLVHYQDKGCICHGKVLGCTYQQYDLHAWRQGDERNLVSWRQWMLLHTRWPLCTINWQIFYFEVLKHWAYSLLIWPIHYYYLFLNLKGRKFSSTEKATLFADRWFAVQPKEFLLNLLKKLKQIYKCVGAQERICMVNTFFQSCSLLSMTERE
jgi:hypothetical protein